MSAKLDVTVSIPCTAWRGAVPAAPGLCRKAARAAFASSFAESAAESFADMAAGPSAEASIVLADDSLVRQLNRTYGARDKATNVLSFPADDGSSGDPPKMLGDVFVAFETMAAEADAEGKTLADHLCHLVVHGVLHLLGHDHQTAMAARRMEGLETRVLNGLGVADPYRDTADG